ncbi:FtsX-like permease family protein, partial [Georgenia subflava]
MIRLTWAQTRRSAGRLAAAAVAIVVGTAFVAATLLAGSLIKDATYGAVTASLGDADVIVRPAGTELTPEVVSGLDSLDGVSAAEGMVQVYGQVRAGGTQDSALLTPVAASAELDPYEWVSGDAPADDGELALTESAAERLGVAPGDEVRVERDVLTTDDEWVTRGVDLVLSGTVADPPAIVAPFSTVLVSRANVETWAAELRPDATVTYESVLVAAADGTAPDALADTLRSAVPDTLVRTAEEEALARTEELTGSTESLTALVLGFGCVAMFVAAIVIANTFQVLVAQRARTLALLRCVGATKAQVHRSVLLEAAALGLLASLAGLAAGLGLGQVALWFLQSADLGIALPAAISPTPAVVAVPLLTGTAVTLLAALGPARAATRVAPVSALR